MSKKVKEAIRDCYNEDFFGDICMPCMHFMECSKLRLEENDVLS